MPHDVNWSVDAYREEFESEEHWKLRKDFMEKWKHNYAEERLVCLARVFANIELLGCRYPPEVMKEVASLSEEVKKTFMRKNIVPRFLGYVLIVSIFKFPFCFSERLRAYFRGFRHV